jgi:putative oligomerization/nucleic acid binding protein
MIGAKDSPQRSDIGGMAFDKFKNFWNVDIKDGVKGKAVVQSASMPTESATATNVQMWLDVYVDGWEPYRVQHHCVVKMSKHPSPGETLPVVVDRKNKERIDIRWDEVKTVDEIMREGGPGAMPGVNVTMGQPQVINLSGAGLNGDLNEQIQQAMEIAQQAMEKSQQQGMPSADPPEADDSSQNMVAERLAALERLASLRDSGVLTDAEFEAEKVKVLAGG